MRTAHRKETPMDEDKRLKLALTILEEHDLTDEYYTRLAIQEDQERQERVRKNHEILKQAAADLGVTIEEVVNRIMSAGRVHP